MKYPYVLTVLYFFAPLLIVLYFVIFGFSPKVFQDGESVSVGYGIEFTISDYQVKREGTDRDILWKIETNTPIEFVRDQRTAVKEKHRMNELEMAYEDTREDGRSIRWYVIEHENRALEDQEWRLGLLQFSIFHGEITEYNLKRLTSVSQ